MLTPKRASASEAPRNTQAQLLQKRTMTRVAAPLLIAAFLLGGPPAAASASTSTNDHISYSSSLPVTSCNGDCPGLCTDPPTCGSSG